MKKLLSILLAAMLLLSLAACGGKDDGDAADKLQGALGGVSEPASSAPTQADGTLLETEFWSVTYPEDWVYSEEDDMGISEGYYAYVTLHIPQEDDPESDTLSVRIDATLEGPASYRDNLYSIGDMRDIVENGTVPTENVGGVDCYRARAGAALTARGMAGWRAQAPLFMYRRRAPWMTRALANF